MNYFTHYWSNDTWENNRESTPEGELLKHISGNLFIQRGVRVGDAIYVVTVKEGKFFLCGKLIVGKFSDTQQMAKSLGVNPEDLWRADEHLSASEATPVNWDLEIPVEITKQLEFINGNTTQNLIFDSKNRLDRQTMRGVRRLTLNSAGVLDKFIPELEPVEDSTKKEQKKLSYAIIAENDESIWDDKTGVIYHFPKRYLSILSEGTKVIYYKGSLKNKAFKDTRMSDSAYYFGIAEIGKIYDDKESNKGDKFALIENFQEFSNPVFIKYEDKYLEYIPASRASNYWRDGVRKIDSIIYQKIVNLAEGLIDIKPDKVEIDLSQETNENFEFESYYEGDKTKRYVTVYERNPKLRKQALQIHGYDCKGCGFNFEKFYGSLGKGFIHIHHIKPVSQFDAPEKVNPETDLVPLCPNCHSMVHRNKNKTISIENLVILLEQNKL